MTAIKKDMVLAPSDNIVAREIEGELIIVPLVSGIGDLDDELFTLNDTGKAIWKCLDGKSSLSEITSQLAKEYDSPASEIEQDVIGLVEELLKRRMLVEVAAV
jgi:hypothetical protein